MNTVYLILGIALVLLTVVDSLWTTLWVDGSAGPISSRLTTAIWRVFLNLIGRDRHQALSLAGPFTLFTIIITWVIGLWAGWVFTFAGGERALLQAHTEIPADWTGRFYFVGYMMFTAGNGDFGPNGDSWQVAAALTNFSGMLIVTLAITYLLSVVSAVVNKRAFGSQVAGLGQSAEDFLSSGWNGKDFSALDLPLSGLSADLTVLSQQYLAYPILQYYHAAQASASPILGLVVLDEALTLLRYGVAEEARPNPAILQSARATVAAFLETMPSAFIKEAPEAPSAPSLQKLRERGIPTVDDAEFYAALENLKERRRKLLGLLRNDGWDWVDRPNG